MNQFFHLLLFAFFSLTIQAQDARAIFTAEKMVFFGIDYSKAKFDIPDIKTPEYQKTYFEAWNAAIVFDNERFNKESTFEKLGVSADLDVVTRRNKAIDIQTAIGKAEGSLPETALENVIADYKDSYKKEGLGMVIVVESMSKKAELMVAYIVFFDIASRKILLSKRVQGEAGGPGLVNHWTNPINRIFVKISQTQFAEWKKEVMKK